MGFRSGLVPGNGSSFPFQQLLWAAEQEKALRPLFLTLHYCSSEYFRQFPCLPLCERETMALLFNSCHECNTNVVQVSFMSHFV